MTKKIEHFAIEEAQSEIRTRVLEIRALPEAELTAELKAERDTLDKKYAEGEVRFRASIKAMKAEQSEGTPVDAEALELRQLTDRASVGGLGAIAAGVLSGHACEGSSRELQQHHHLKGNQIPIELLRAPMVEHRTTGITPGPTDAGADQRPIIPAVFPQSVAAFLGITGQSVAVGEQAFAVVSTSASPGAPAEGADQAHSTAAFESAALVPTRLQASLFFSVEDAARIQGLSDALRLNLSDALSDELDDQILTNSTNGLFSSTNLSNNNTSTLDTFITLKKRIVYDAIDGKYANNAGDLRIVMGSASYAFAGSLYRGNNGDVDALESIMGKVAGLRVSSHVPSVSGNKQNLVVARGTAQHVAVALWQGVDLIEDPFSLAKSGEVILTARMLFAAKILRKDGFRKVQLQHA